MWHLASHDVSDISSYATDLVARIYEFLEKRPRSEYSENDLTRSAEIHIAALEMKPRSFCKFVQDELAPPRLPSNLPSIIQQGVHITDANLDRDVLLALELASGQDQYEALRHYEQVRRDHVLALTIAMQVDDEDDDI